MTEIAITVHDGFVINGKPPLSPDERRRRVVQLCCSLMRNLAFHRAGLESEVKRNLLNPNHSQGGFRLQAHGNFFDISVLDWCKLFADWKGEHHWRLVVENPDQFEGDLHRTLDVTTVEFSELIKNVKHYRDRFVAHLDKEREMLLPALDTAKGAIVFLHKRLVQQAGGCGDWLSGLPTSPEELDQGFAQASLEAQSVYADALARLAAMER